MKILRIVSVIFLSIISMLNARSECDIPMKDIIEQYLKNIEKKDQNYLKDEAYSIVKEKGNEYFIPLLNFCKEKNIDKINTIIFVNGLFGPPIMYIYSESNIYKMRIISKSCYNHYEGTRYEINKNKLINVFDFEKVKPPKMLSEKLVKIDEGIHSYLYGTKHRIIDMTEFFMIIIRREKNNFYKLYYIGGSYDDAPNVLNEILSLTYPLFKKEDFSNFDEIKKPV